MHILQHLYIGGALVYSADLAVTVELLTSKTHTACQYLYFCTSKAVQQVN
jgi:hypothetical protein